ncbi:hypothetical protein A7A78_13165 [Aequorivita soesokkakensis]|uniref:Uncharacterized protein n=1 Tax=Aequorivita soesokkakensis TaxID=1385699 RepID=A0A1A9LC89_9FLAO|nr:hypothetical protein [Aequorivita soesokkakensis]OAD90898.1 hypothetical protein A7A78_13165 [Aequorivita soesokkakensis]
MKSFVDGFIEKRISIETLQSLLNVNYQRNIFLEMIIDNGNKNNFEIQEGNKFYLKLKNDKNCIFVLLTTEKKTLEQIKQEVDYLKNEKIVYSVIFDPDKISENLVNPIYIDTKEWMNRIISHGINKQILHLQFLRDLDFSYE